MAAPQSSDAAPWSFRPIDLARDLSDAIRFRRDAHVCTFGDAGTFDEAYYVGRLEEKIARDPWHAVHVYAGDERIGQIELNYLQDKPWVGYVNLYYLAPAWRGRGLAARLDDFATAFLRKRGHVTALLSVGPRNLPALRFYQRQGWVDRGPRRDVAGLHWMERELAATPLPVEPLQTPRLWLRGVSELDFSSYERHFADYEVVRTLARRVPWPYPEGGVEAHLRQQAAAAEVQEQWLWGIFTKEAPFECVGAISLLRPGIPENRGFWLARKHWGHGYMTEAATTVTDYAFDKLGFKELLFANARGNAASRRVKEKMGARFLGVRAGEFVDPALTEQELWETTREDWLVQRIMR